MILCYGILALVIYSFFGIWFIFMALFSFFSEVLYQLKILHLYNCKKGSLFLADVRLVFLKTFLY